MFESHKYFWRFMMIKKWIALQYNMKGLKIITLFTFHWISFLLILMQQRRICRWNIIYGNKWKMSNKVIEREHLLNLLSAALS